MTGLSVDHGPGPESSSILDRLLRYGGVVGLIAVILTLWLTRSFASGQDTIDGTTRATLTAVTQHHTEAGRDAQLQRQQLWAICMVVANSDRQLERFCEVGTR
jgi:hypothetical protein